ncbi:uncharacterized protein FOMMEDRAFT_165165 [Fomitiporia mediterranea MF3/22]|uniref:uncharacterized protein n=1 Tax=Fomitiporia mediterranea (strain MF3/22) TaxID=694068 RepID=UPI0004407A9E|nr:uncharacterized protein FOMMEDRAFT_165165 [Fomitiporia mediterranea MF3/22]EJD06322.1 hypothetical protein FOMMEDRAFT_165165 [Fomitiporia mediterranea MF3/22]
MSKINAAGTGAKTVTGRKNNALAVPLSGAGGTPVGSTIICRRNCEIQKAMVTPVSLDGADGSIKPMNSPCLIDYSRTFSNVAKFRGRSWKARTNRREGLYQAELHGSSVRKLALHFPVSLSNGEGTPEQYMARQLAAKEFNKTCDIERPEKAQHLKRKRFTLP